MGCAGSVGSKDNTVRAMATNRKTFLETDPDTCGNSHCSSLQQTFRIATQTAIGMSGGVHTSVFAGIGSWISLRVCSSFPGLWKEQRNISLQGKDEEASNLHSGFDPGGLVC